MVNRVGPLLAAGLLALVQPILGLHDYYLFVLTQALLFAALAESWSLLARCGQISFGHAAFFGSGAYATALLTLRAGGSPGAGLALAAGAGGLLAAAIGGFSLPLKGPYFSLATLAFAEGLRALVINLPGLTEGAWGLVGVPGLPALQLAGLRLDLGGRPGNYYAALTLLVVAHAAVAALRRTRAGVAFAAIRENPDRAEALGVPVARWTLFAFTLSGAIAAVTGALYVHLMHFVDPGVAFNPSVSVAPLVMSFFGGALRPAGPAAGALVLYGVNELVLAPILPRGHQFLYGVAILAAIVYLPQGLVGWLRPEGAGHAAA